MQKISEDGAAEEVATSVSPEVTIKFRNPASSANQRQSATNSANRTSSMMSSLIRQSLAGASMLPQQPRSVRCPRCRQIHPAGPCPVPLSVRPKSVFVKSSSTESDEWHSLDSSRRASIDTSELGDGHYASNLWSFDPNAYKEADKRASVGPKPQVVILTCSEEEADAEQARLEFEYAKNIDRGYAWVVLGVVFLINASTFGTARAYGLIFGKLARDGGLSRADAAWPFNFMGAFENMSGPVCGCLLALTASWRLTVVSGSILVTLGHLLAALWADSQTGQFVAMGLMCGFGASFVSISFFQVNNAYFDRYRSLAFGIGMTGAAFGTLVISPTCQYFLDHNPGTRACYLILSAFIAPNILLALLLKPIRPPPMRREVFNDCTSRSAASPSQVSVTSKSTPTTEEPPPPPLPPPPPPRPADRPKEEPNKQQVEKPERPQQPKPRQQKLSPQARQEFEVQQQQAQQQSEQQQIEKSPKKQEGEREQQQQQQQQQCEVPIERISGQAGQRFDSRADITASSPWTWVKLVVMNPWFHLIWPTQLLFCWLNFTFGLIIVDFSKDRGMGDENVAYLVPCLAFGQLFGRLVLSSLVDLKLISNKTFTIVCFLAISISTLLLNNMRHETIACPQQYRDLVMLAMVFVQSMFVALLYILLNGLVLTYVDISLQPISLGISSFTGSFLLLPRARVIGHYRDTIGEYDALLAMFSYVSLGAGIAWLVLPPACGYLRNLARGRVKKEPITGIALSGSTNLATTIPTEELNMTSAASKSVTFGPDAKCDAISES